MKKSFKIAETFFMKKQLIHELFEKFEQARYLYQDIECWSARELQALFNYSEWRNFVKVIDKAKDACKNVGENIPDHFVDSNKMILLAKGAQREIEDIALTRYACYLIAQNGDPLKRPWLRCHPFKRRRLLIRRLLHHRNEKETVSTGQQAISRLFAYS